MGRRVSQRFFCTRSTDIRSTSLGPPVVVWVIMVCKRQRRRSGKCARVQEESLETRRGCSQMKSHGRMKSIFTLLCCVLVIAAVGRGRRRLQTC